MQEPQHVYIHVSRHIHKYTHTYICRGFLVTGGLCPKTMSVSGHTIWRVLLLQITTCLAGGANINCAYLPKHSQKQTVMSVKLQSIRTVNVDEHDCQSTNNNRVFVFGYFGLFSSQLIPSVLSVVASSSLFNLLSTSLFFSPSLRSVSFIALSFFFFLRLSFPLSLLLCFVYRL